MYMLNLSSKYIRCGVTTPVECTPHVNESVMGGGGGEGGGGGGGLGGGSGGGGGLGGGLETHASCHWVCSGKVAQGPNTNGAPPPLCSRWRDGEAKSPAYTCTVWLTLLVSFASNQTRPGMARIISIASVTFAGRSTGRPAFAIC